MQALWAGPHAEFHGEFVDFPRVTCSPRPTQSRIPIVVGGDTTVAINRAARLADGYFPGEGQPDRLAGLIERVRRAAEDHGRDPKSIAINAMFGVQMADPVRGAEQLAGIGVDRVMVPAFFFAGPGGLDRLRTFGEQVVAQSA
jgi:alkanesulfonate monooxygenase SsuD/methylene tetrahydromethanopterin reductase-like flavin-dependent oxidoreductase (luciferase family)